MGENPCSSYLNYGTLQDCAQFFPSVFGFCWVLSPSTSTPGFPYKSASSVMLFSSSPEFQRPKFDFISFLQSSFLAFLLSRFTETPLISSEDNFQLCKYEHLKQRFVPERRKGGGCSAGAGFAGDDVWPCGRQ